MSRGDALARVTAALEAHGTPVRNGKALCPAHPDVKESLSVRQAGDRAKVKCFAGCDDRDVLAALGLAVADLFDEPRQQRDGGDWTPWRDKCDCRPVARYPYVDEHGELLYEVVRGEHKEFAQRRPDPSSRSGWRWSLGGVRQVPYRLPQVIEAVAAGRTVWICEGEKDVAALERAGEAATTNSGGADAWRDELDQWLRGADVVIVVDRDDAGYKRGADLRRRLAAVAKSVKVVEPAVDREKADAHDHLAAGFGLNDFLPLVPVTSVTSIQTPSESNTVTEVTGGESTRARVRENEPADLLAGLRDGEWLNSQEFPPLEWIVPGLIPEGFTLFVGAPKVGKSWVLLGAMLAVAAGGHALGQIQCESRRVLNLAMEDGDRRQQDRCRSLMGRDPIPGRYGYLTRLAEPGAMGRTIDAYLDRYDDVGMITIDTLGKIMPDARNGESVYSRDYRIGSALKNVADSRRGLSVVAVHHDRKAAAEDFVESVSGTNGLAGAADTIVVLTRKRQSEEALLQITGRDVIEAEYALRLNGRVWELDGRTLADAARAARQRRDDGDLGETSRQILDHIRQHPEGCKSSEISSKFGDGARMYLKRLLEAGRVDKLDRGLYVLPLDPSWEESA